MPRSTVAGLLAFTLLAACAVDRAAAQATPAAPARLAAPAAPAAPPKPPAAPEQASPPDKEKGQGNLDLVKGLKATPGCLGVETARTGSGKNVIFAWFKDKQAVEDWYNSDVHQAVMSKYAADYDFAGPLEHLSDDAGPIMVVASITPAAKSKFKQLTMPVSQIAVELYAPLPGGAALGGRFAPAGFKVPHLREIAGEEGDAKPDKPAK